MVRLYTAPMRWARPPSLAVWRGGGELVFLSSFGKWKRGASWLRLHAAAGKVGVPAQMWGRKQGTGLERLPVAAVQVGSSLPKQLCQGHQQTRLHAAELMSGNVPLSSSLARCSHVGVIGHGCPSEGVPQGRQPTIQGSRQRYARAADTNGIPAPWARLRGWLRRRRNNPVYTWSPRPSPLLPSACPLHRSAPCRLPSSSSQTTATTTFGSAQT